MTEKPKYYSLTNILKHAARYYMIIGERSNGKTYSVKERIVTRYAKEGTQGAIIRRWGDDLKGKRAQQMFEDIVANGLVKKLTSGKWNDITYQSGCWYFSRFDEKLNKNVMCFQPFCFAFSLNAVEHDKSTSYSNVCTILFDEFTTRKLYLDDEFIVFMNVLSTIIRQRDNVEIFMCGNTVNKYCPYFTEMGLTNVTKMQQGDIDVYQYGDSGLTVAVEYCDTSKKNKKRSDVYFAFDNPKLNMITKGSWEIPTYPHLPRKYKKDDVRYNFFILFCNEIVHCEVIYLDDCSFVYCHRKTTPIKEDTNILIYTVEYSEKRMYRRHIHRPITDRERKIWKYFVTDKVFYQDNDIGEVVRNYIAWSKSDGGIQ